VGGKEEKRRQRQEQQEQEVAETLRKLEFMESQGVGVQVDRVGRVGAFISGGKPVEEAAGWDGVRAIYEDLYQMHKSERERGVILKAWERFQNEEG
jgi:hypothetical protein